eukprot:m.338429 g.338429  ORF g.338429 m.338429 type:complete len:244 (-) comp55733_c0_seq6:2444-3175(-)
MPSEISSRKATAMRSIRQPSNDRAQYLREPMKSVLVVLFSYVKQRQEMVTTAATRTTSSLLTEKDIESLLKTEAERVEEKIAVPRPSMFPLGGAQMDTKTALPASTAAKPARAAVKKRPAATSKDDDDSDQDVIYSDTKPDIKSATTTTTLAEPRGRGRAAPAPKAVSGRGRGARGTARAQPASALIKEPLTICSSPEADDDPLPPRAAAAPVRRAFQKIKDDDDDDLEDDEPFDPRAKRARK